LTQGDAVALHVYLDDVSDCGGPTVFVPAESCGDPAYALPAMSMMPGVAGHPRNQSRQRAEEYFSSAASLADAAELRRTLYARESGVRFELGTVALYQLNVWHRGTPVTTVRQQLSQTLRFSAFLYYDRQMRDTKEDCTPDRVPCLLSSGTAARCAHDCVSQRSGRLDPVPRRLETKPLGLWQRVI
jgi:hypothetical protein